MKAVRIRTALRGKRQITSSMTYEEFRVACPKLAAFDKGAVTVGRFATQSPWENHPDGDELLYIVAGKIDVILRPDGRQRRVTVRSGSIFVVPRAVWHRQIPRPVATVLSALPTAHGLTSWADDPPQNARKVRARRTRRRS
jgi:mannose-6-phosphate isomerase-like protein (cupin superfamily)